MVLMLHIKIFNTTTVQVGLSSDIPIYFTGNGGWTSKLFTSSSGNSNGQPEHGTPDIKSKLVGFFIFCFFVFIEDITQDCYINDL